jgi:hypothetical protein
MKRPQHCPLFEEDSITKQNDAHNLSVCGHLIYFCGYGLEVRRYFWRTHGTSRWTEPSRFSIRHPQEWAIISATLLSKAERTQSDIITEARWEMRHIGTRSVGEAFTLSKQKSLAEASRPSTYHTPVTLPPVGLPCPPLNFGSLRATCSKVHLPHPASLRDRLVRSFSL